MMAKKKRNDLRDAKTVLRILSILAVAGAAILLFGLLVHSKSGLTTSTGLLWAAASAAAGALAGFLFGIPRVLQTDQPVAPAGEQQASDPSSDQDGNGTARYQVNTNLEQISDWLTKIIVGIGLVELRNVPGAVQDLAEYFAKSVPGQGLEAMGGAIVVYFGVLGFLLGYLATRLYLAGAFSRADRLMNFGDFEMTDEQVTNQQNALLTDMLKSVSGMLRSGPSRAMRRGMPSEGEPGQAPPEIRSVLWVDDNPSNNGVLIQNLRDQGLRVELAATSQGALDQLAAHPYDRIITDMGRVEGGQDHPRAGIDLIEQLKSTESFRDIPVIVYTSRRGEVEFGQQALAAGAADVTSSPVELLSLLGSD